jgi:SSS family solute:Na+ symporter
LAGLLSEVVVFVVYYLDVVGFLWLNVIGALSVILLGLMLQMIIDRQGKR